MIAFLNKDTNKRMNLGVKKRMNLGLKRLIGIYDLG
jgi:hypothetical protein